MVLALGFSQNAQAQTWIVAGSPSAAFNGESWKPDATVNQMTLKDGIYVYESKDFTLASDNIEFKVTNGSWNEAYPASNYVIQNQGSGKYDLYITFNPETKEVTGTATKKTSEDIPDYYIVAGSSTALFGSSWNGDDENNLMTEQADGTYKLVKENVELTAGNIEYKFVKNGSTWYPTQGGNLILSITKPGTYNVTFVFKPALGDGDATLKEINVHELVIDYMSLTGPLFGGWPGTDEEGIWQNNYVDMQKSGDKVWTYTLTDFEASEASYAYKASANHKWGVFELPSSGDETWYPEEGNGIYTIVFTATVDGESSSLTAVGTKTGELVIDDPTLYILGEANDNVWQSNVGLEMTYTDGKFTAEDVTFTGANEGFSYFSFTTML